MTPTGLGLWLSILLLFGMLACLETGFRLGVRRAQRNELAYEGVGAVEAAVFGLVGLLLALSFAGAMTRLDARRQLIIDEANAAGTAYARLDLLPAAAQPELKQLFREYLDARLQFYDRIRARESGSEELSRIAGLQRKIWSRAVAASQADSSQNSARMLLPAVNQMFDVAAARGVMLNTRLPRLIFFLMYFVSLLSALLAGYAMSKRKVRARLHMLLYAACISATVFAIVDLDDPRSGFIRLDSADHALVDQRRAME